MSIKPKEGIARLNGAKLYPLFFPYKNSGGHPKREDQHALANQLCEFISKNISW